MSSRQLINEYVVTQPSNTELRLVVKGFTPSERQLLAALIKLSQRRQPRLNLINGFDESGADIVMIDATDAHAMDWAHTNSWLARKVVIWVDAARDHGGYAVSRPIQWSSLPMLLVRALEQVPAKAEGFVGVSRCNAVLVVDDSLAVRGQLRALLERRGFVVTDVESAEAAIQMATKSTYACILMDVLMPGLNGYEACRLIKANTSGKRANIVMLTSRSSPFDRIKGKMAGCDAYLTKPVNPDHLYEVISRFVAKPVDNGVLPQRISTLQFAK